jgi:tRNA(adenine34) deaminase
LESDDFFMSLALEEAVLAESAGEVPVGAVVVHKGQVIGRGRNRTRELNDPSAHAEILALRDASQAVGSHRLSGAELFVTLEPCTMCSGAIFHSRLARVVFGAPDPKTGTAGSVLDLFSQRQLNHHTLVTGGVLREECQRILQSFFVSARKRNREEQISLREDALRLDAQALPCPDDSTIISSYFYTSEGYRIRYLDSNPANPKYTLLCIHELGFWSFQVWSLVSRMAHHGVRVIVPDLLGHGLSDRPKKSEWHSVRAHVSSLTALTKYMDLTPTHIVAIGNAKAIGTELCSVLKIDASSVLSIVTSRPPVLTALAESSRQQSCRSIGGLSKKQLNHLVGFPDNVVKALIAHFPDKGYAAVLDAIRKPDFSPENTLNSPTFCPVVVDEIHLDFLERELLIK